MEFVFFQQLKVFRMNDVTKIDFFINGIQKLSVVKFQIQLIKSSKFSASRKCCTPLKFIPKNVSPKVYGIQCRLKSFSSNAFL